MKQCPSCGCECGYTKTKGCQQYMPPKPEPEKIVTYHTAYVTLDEGNYTVSFLKEVVRAMEGAQKALSASMVKVGERDTKPAPVEVAAHQALEALRREQAYREDRSLEACIDFEPALDNAIVELESALGGYVPPQPTQILRPALHIGFYTIREHAPGDLWISNISGEEMQISKANMLKWLDKLWKKEF